MQLDDCYRNCEQLTPESLREHNKNIYWNLVWYFADNHLPYDFIVPYANDEELWAEFLHTNDHLKARNKVRLDQMLSREGGVDNYIRLIEERLRKELALQESERQATRSSSRGKRKRSIVAAR